MKTYFKIICLIFLFSLLIPLFTKAIAFENPFKTKSFEALINAIADFIFLVAIAIVPIMIIVAAFYFLTSGGNSEKVNTAKKILLFTFIGLFIVFLGKAIPGIIWQILFPCQSYSFQGGTVRGTVSPDPVFGRYYAGPGENLNTTCDYGAHLDCIDSFVGPNQCLWTGWDGTKATFSCQAPLNYEIYTHVCKLRSRTGSNCCAQSNDNGSIYIPTPTCRALIDRLIVSYGSECGDVNYDPITDVNKSKEVNLFDMIRIISCEDEACCQDLWDATDPC